MKFTVLTVTVAAGMLMAPAFAQSTEVGKRNENQQDRIATGVKSGSLTAGETSNLEKKESAIHQEVRTDRALNGGKLTNSEKRVVNGQQNQVSRQIYRDKHNAAAQHYGKNEVDARRENQQDRIANGIASGKLNAAQASRLEKSETAINHETARDRAANGGRLTAAEKQRVNRQQNAVSGRIYKDKH